MHFLITAGGTKEYIDPVRFISNASSGKMGYALAGSALKAGHKVTLITAETNLKKPQNAKVIKVVNARDMFLAVKNNFDDCDCLIMAAAVSDYTVDKNKTKIKKNSSDLTLQLKPTKDILKWASNHKKSQLLAGFALEDRQLRKRAEEKLIEKKLDMIVANRPAVIGSQRSTVEIKVPNRDWLKIENSAKSSIANKIIKLITEQISRQI
ncbi:MAG: phosphopantothenoylcysteine decarboxylase [Planctomycetes bacterium]|nr:phosphopantothenoylcysteine decarboxylase [Planctomycetota bacterium]MBL7106970.1 phosphopantothenoylcysteine decarboxylase [Phycisphaerae bacterium]